MFRYFIPIILIGASVAGFVTFTNPTLKSISTLKNEISSYNEALTNAKALEGERDKLTKKYNSVDTANLSRLQKLLPDSVDNIRLILEIEKLASPYGMVLKDVKYESASKKDEAKSTTNQGLQVSEGLMKDDGKQYGTWELEFSTKGTYQNFVNFVKDIESNLRIVDISSVKFSSDSDLTLGKTQPTDSYKYEFKIKTYWLKN
ncbi:MAG TPA: hypothetical protein PKZ36_02430 [Candidatus Paceibacterota bacterium]|nr:hypothetical protein [Candidatus Paceibacterota bacterium]HPT18238.1 hypothetical protein [Candidatus Paceibacterota bacterium]